jgi:hypothetical protein
MTDESDRRARAVRRLQAKRAFTIHLAVYLMVNAFLVLVWAVTDRGYFWPIWPMAGWGVAVAIQGFTTYVALRPLSDEAIEREMRKGP